MRITLLLSLVLATSAQAEDFRVQSADVEAGQPMPNRHVFNGFGCTGDNISPALSWSGAPEETKSFAVTVHDPDAPIPSGWWHWQVYNIPGDTSRLERGASTNGLPEPAAQARNDFSQNNWGGPCPPKGDDAHEYHFRVYALDTQKLDLPEKPSAALVSFKIRSHALAQASLTIPYSR